MSIEILLDLIRHNFSPEEGKILVRSLQQDPLVWQFFQDEEKCPPYLETALRDLTDFQPGKISTWLIEKNSKVSLQGLEDETFPLPDAIKQEAIRAYETILNAGLPPADLMTAGLIALYLREKRIEDGNWRGISSEILENPQQNTDHKDYLIWRTPFACLYQICPDFDELVLDFQKNKSTTPLSCGVPIFVHTYLANPMDTDVLLNNLYAFASNLPIDWQLEVLKWLEASGKGEIRERLAKNLIQSKSNVDVFAQIFSELESAEVTESVVDPLEKQIRYTLPEDINRLAAFYYYCGNQEKSAETYQLSSALLESIQAQTIFQSLSSNPQKATDISWMNIIKSVPNSRKARLFFIQSLIKEKKIAEARQHLEELPYCPEKEWLQNQIDLINSEETSAESKSLASLKLKMGENFPPLTSYYISNVSLTLPKEIIRTCQQAKSKIDCIPLIDKILDDNMHDLEFVTAARDLYEEGQHTGKAIELTSYLERLEPEDKAHKRKLSQLYSQMERWQEAFSTLQGLVKSDSRPKLEDLERFAESAIRTDRIEMAVSVCQNILKQDAKNTKALVLLGESYMAKGDAVKAIQHMEQVVEMIPKEAQTWLTLAKLWRKSGHPDRAYEILKKGVVTLPNNTDLLRSHGSACIERKAPSDALAYLRKANELDPQNIEGKYHLAHAEYLLGQYEQAFDHLDFISKDYENDPRSAKLLGQVLLALGKKQEAETILMTVVRQDPSDTETVLAVSRLIIDRLDAQTGESTEEGNKSLADLQAILQKSHESNPEEYPIMLHLADIDRLNGLTEKAFASYTKLSKEGPSETTIKDWRLHYGLGKSATALGNLEVGLAALQDAASRQSENLLILHALAETYQKADLNGKAQDTAKAALKLAPQQLDNILWYANFKTSNNEPEESVKAIQEALQLNPERVELKLWLSKAHLAAGSHMEAQKTITDLIVNSDPSPEVLHQAAYTCVQLNNLDLAAEALETGKQKQQNSDPLLLMDLAEIYSRQNQLKKALESLQCEQSTLVDYPQIGILKSEVLINLGQYEAAYVVLKTIEEIVKGDLDTALNQKNPKEQSPLLYTYDFSDQGFLVQLGQVALAVGHLEESQENLAKAFELDPENLKIRSALTHSYLMTLDLEQVLKLSKEKNLNPENAFKKGNDWLDLLCSQVETYLMQDRIEEATACINECTLSDNTSPRLLAIQSRLAIHTGDIDKAENYLHQAIEKYQQTLGGFDSLALETTFRKHLTLSGIGEAARTLDDYIMAAKYHQLAWEILPDQPRQNMLFAKTLIKAAELQRVAEALSIENHAPGKEFIAENNQALATALIEKLPSNLGGNHIMCLKARGTAAYTGKWPLSLNAEACLTGADEAAAILLSTQDNHLAFDILEVYSDNLFVLQAYGVHALRFNTKNAQEWVEKALMIDTVNPINHALLAMVNQNEPERAIKSIETALEFWPDEPAWHALAADLYAKIGNTFAASRHIDLALDARPEDPGFWQKSAEIQLQQNELRRAKEDLKRSATYQSENPNVYLKMADINRRMGSVNEAIENIRKASQLDPENADIALEELQYLFDTKNFEEAEVKAEEILQDNSKNEKIRIFLAQAKARQGKFEAALEVLKPNLVSHPNNINFQLEILKIRKDQEGIQTILPDLTSLAQENPENSAVLATLTDWLIKTNQLDEAEETAQKLLKISPKQADVHLMLGRLQRKIGQLDQAISHLSDAIIFDPNSIEAYIELGKTYQDRRDLDQAIETFQKGTQVNASDPRPYFFAGMALKECKDYRNAEMMLKQAKKFSPEDANIIRQLGVVTALNLINNLRETR